jgi:hypothetical protein
VFPLHQTDGYDATGCYNLLCSGFVQTSETVAIGAAIAPISGYGGSQYQIEIMLWKVGYTIYNLTNLTNLTSFSSQPPKISFH